jgi:hypothetical protein
VDTREAGASGNFDRRAVDNVREARCGCGCGCGVHEGVERGKRRGAGPWGLGVYWELAGSNNTSGWREEALHGIDGGDLAARPCAAQANY